MDYVHHQSIMRFDLERYCHNNKDKLWTFCIEYFLYNSNMHMMEKEKYIQILAARLGFENSLRLKHLLDQLMTEREAQLLAGLPETIQELCARFEKSNEEMLKQVRDLFERGLLLISENEADDLLYVFDTKPGRFMDSIMFDPRYRRDKNPAFFDEWKAFYNEEMIPTHAERPEAELPFRVITVSKEIESQQEILPYEHVEKIIASADRIAVQDCPCRVRERNCDNPLQTCISLDRLANYVIARGIGREINKEEAIQVLRQAEDLGLIHEVDNNVKPTVICNCCTCCCTFLRAVTRYQQNAVVARSRYRAVIDANLCNECGLCSERCQFDAIIPTEGETQIDQQKCIGCGLCVSACPNQAIQMILVENVEHIPTTRATFFEDVDRIPFSFSGEMKDSPE